MAKSDPYICQFPYNRCMHCGGHQLDHKGPGRKCPGLLAQGHWTPWTRETWEQEEKSLLSKRTQDISEAL